MATARRTLDAVRAWQEGLITAWEAAEIAEVDGEQDLIHAARLAASRLGQTTDIADLDAHRRSRADLSGQRERALPSTTSNMPRQRRA